MIVFCKSTSGYAMASQLSPQSRCIGCLDEPEKIGSAAIIQPADGSMSAAVHPQRQMCGLPPPFNICIG